MFSAAKFWFPEQMSALETAAAPQSQSEPDNSLDAAVRAFSQPQVPEAWWHVFEQIAPQTEHRLRSFLHQGTLKAYYFRYDGCHRLSREFWATAQADGVIVSGIYWPFGRPTRTQDQGLYYPLFVNQSELDALLSEQPAKNPGLPGAKMPDLVAALRTLDHLPNREKQREALRKLPEFERYHLTDDVLGEAEKQVPRKPGRKPPRPKQ